MVLKEEYLLMVYIGEPKTKEAFLTEVRKAKRLCKEKKGCIPDTVHVHSGGSFNLTEHGKSKIFADRLVPAGNLILYNIKRSDN